MECPLANLQIKVETINQSSQNRCPFHAHSGLPADSKIHHAVPLVVRDGSHQVSEGTANLLHDIGGGDRIREFCTRFYARAFLDHTLKPFFFKDDGATAHARRLADWIIEKMGGEGRPWSDSGRFGMRQPSHHAAWNSDKRAPEVRGEHFKLDDCRIWMRLHFWAMRECGMHQHEAFWNWYVEFIEHFVAVYERRAPRYAEEDSQWSANPVNIEHYIAQNYQMLDVIGIGRN